jgi:GDP-D-mannose dehydratase
VDLLIGDYSKARKNSAGNPRRPLTTLVKLMVDADIKLVKDHQAGKGRVAS